MEVGDDGPSPADGLLNRAKRFTSSKGTEWMAESEKQAQAIKDAQKPEPPADAT